MYDEKEVMIQRSAKMIKEVKKTVHQEKADILWT